jgi:class 3 adenylate cyclase
VTTENVAVLFTDMVGSTALASGLSPDAADELRRRHVSALRQAVAEAGGTEVKNLGDGLMVVFASTSAALSCAVTMQQGIERDNRARKQTVGLRVGLSVGEVTREEDDYFGDPVIEAARLCAACEGGQILAADVVRLMAGRRSRHECTSVGPLLLKGFPDAVETVEVRWEPLGGTATNNVPLPDRLGIRPAAGVIGRAGETATIVDAFKRVAGREGRNVFLVSGEAGLGKSTLIAVRALRRRSHHPVPAVRRSARPLRHPCHRRRAPRARRARIGAGPADPCPGSTVAGSSGVEGHRYRDRALPPLRRGGRAAGEGVRASAGRLGTRGLAVGGQSQLAAVASRDHDGATTAVADARDVSAR